MITINTVTEVEEDQYSHAGTISATGRAEYESMMASFPTHQFHEPGTGEQVTYTGSGHATFGGPSKKSKESEDKDTSDDVEVVVESANSHAKATPPKQNLPRSPNKEAQLLQQATAVFQETLHHRERCTSEGLHRSSPFCTSVGQGIGRHKLGEGITGGCLVCINHQNEQLPTKRSRRQKINEHNTQ